MSDPSTAHATDQALRHQLEKLRALYALTETLMASSDVAEVYEAAMDGFRGALGVERVAILISEADGVPRFKAWRGLSPRYRQTVEGHTFWPADAINPAPVTVGDVATDPAMADFRDVARAEGFAALVAMPLLVKGRIIGKCMLYFDEPRQLSPDEMRLAHTVADHVAFAVERKRSEAEIWQTSTLLRAIIEGTPDAIFVTDRQGRYLMTNQAAAGMVGRDPRTLAGLDAGSAFGRDDAAAIRGAHARVMAERRTQSETERLTTADGRRRVFFATRGPLCDAAGAASGAFAILRDVTEQNEAQEKLHQSESRFRSLLQNASDITTILSADGDMRYQSPAFYRLTGWTEADVLGANAFSFVHLDDRDAAMAVFAETLRSGQESPPVQFRFRRADGSYLTLEGIGVNRVDDPLIGGMVVNSRDVTERNRLAEELRQAQKMEAIGRLAGGIAHDFNNLLTVIGGYSEAALLEQDVVEMRRCVEEVRRAGERASQLTTQLLAFARRRVIAPSAVELNTAILALAGMLQRLIGTDVRLETSLRPEVGFIRVDRGQLEQVVMNLAINARDAMPGGGTLTLATALEVAADRAVLTVSDTGRGMDRETVSHMFEPFFTTKGPGQGTGLGLATVYGIVTQHGGTVAVDSTPGLGTTFALSFPRDAAANAGALVPVPSGGDTTGQETVLLVEDEPMVRSLVRSILTAKGYTVREASSGEEALERFGDDLGRVHLLLTDVVMPGINGRVLAERLAARRPDLKVLFMSGYTEDAVLGARGPGMQFLQKPFAPDALRSMVRQVLDA